MSSMPDSLRMMAKAAEHDSPFSFENPVNQLGGLGAFMEVPQVAIPLEAAHSIFVDYPRRKRRGQADAAVASLVSGGGQLAVSAMPGGSAATSLGRYGRFGAGLAAYFGLPMAAGMAGAKYDRDGRVSIGPEEERAIAKAISSDTAWKVAGGVGAAALGAAALVDWLRRRKGNGAKAKAKAKSKAKGV